MLAVKLRMWSALMPSHTQILRNVSMSGNDPRSILESVAAATPISRAASRKLCTRLKRPSPHPFACRLL